MIGQKKKKNGLREELSSIVVDALAPSGNGTPESKDKSGGGVLAVATGAALFVTGRALVKGRDKLQELARSNKDEPELDEEEEEIELSEEDEDDPELSEEEYEDAE